MAMPRVSNSSPLALRKDDDSVDNEKNNCAPPLKKMKVDSDLVGEEEDNTTDSVSKEREEEILKLFKFFKALYQRKYADKEEEEHRFGVFKNNLENPAPTVAHCEFGINCPGLADLTLDEIDEHQPGTIYYFYCCTPLSYYQDLFDECGSFDS